MSGLPFQLLAFMYGWLTFYHQGHEVATDFNPHMLELQSRIQKVRTHSPSWVCVCVTIISIKLCKRLSLLQTRENFNASREDIHALRRKMLEVRNGVSVPVHNAGVEGFGAKLTCSLVDPEANGSWHSAQDVHSLWIPLPHGEEGLGHDLEQVLLPLSEGE